MSSYKFTPRAVASPDAPQKSLVRKRARSGGANWVQVTREKSASKAKRPRTAGSQQPACTHKEHDILTTAEATALKVIRIIFVTQQHGRWTGLCKMLTTIMA